MQVDTSASTGKVTTTFDLAGKEDISYHSEKDQAKQLQQLEKEQQREEKQQAKEEAKQEKQQEKEEKEQAKEEHEAKKEEEKWEDDRQDRLDAKVATKTKDMKFAVHLGVETMKKAPQIMEQAAVMATNMTSLAFEEPHKTKHLVKVVSEAMKEGAVMAYKERATLGAAGRDVGHGVDNAKEVAHKSPNKVRAAMDKGIAGAMDLVSGIKKPDPMQVGEGGVEEGQGGANISSAAARAPDNVAGAMWDSVKAGAKAASVPLKHPMEAIKIGLHSGQSAGQAGLLAAKAPVRVKDTLSSTTAAATQLGGAAGGIVTAANFMPGGTISMVLMVLWLAPILLTAAFAGLMFGVLKEVYLRLAHKTREVSAEGKQKIDEMKMKQREVNGN